MTGLRRRRRCATVYIVTPDEALDNERESSAQTATWRFAAENVRDFAWASSRKFIWDAKGHQQPGADQETVMAMSFYPKEGGTLWSDYSTEVVIHTLEVYSRFSFDYPYPTAQSVNVGFVGGMEYPMITFNGPRAELQEDGSRTYSLAEKRFLIGVVIHEIGHFYFPMIVNSDERQWTWMDEGLNSYLDSVAGREWDAEIPWGVEPRYITDYMESQNQVPVMTQSDSVLRLGPNAYSKPATAINILRETIMGRELFDLRSKNILDCGHSNDRHRQTFSAPWKKLPALISTGSGAAGFIPLIMWILPWIAFTRCVWIPKILTSTFPVSANSRSRCRRVSMWNEIVWKVA